MKVLITGVTGFIGSHLTQRLMEEGHDVYGLARYVTKRYVLGESKPFKTVYADVREAFRVKEVIRNLQPDIVFHLAAISAQAYSYAHPQEVMETNFIGTINLAEACYKLIPHFQHFIFAGSAEEYGVQPVGTPIKETAQLNPHSPYAVSKVASDIYLMYMFKAYDFPVTVLRAFNTYGRIDNKHFLVERIITQMLQDRKGTVRLGDPEPKISWMHIEDHVNGYLTAMKQCKVGERFNLSPNIGWTVEDVAEFCSELTDFKGNIEWYTIPKRPIQVKYLVGDSSKACTILNWIAITDLREGLIKTVNAWKIKVE